jgi:hypothetical protein
MPATIDKYTALAHVKPGAISNRLFFQARNLAIEAVLLRLENQLLRQGFDVNCVWTESSFYGPQVYLRMPNPKKDASWVYGECAIHIKRERIDGPSDLSQCYYTLVAVHTTEHWRGRQPQKLLDFRAAVQALADSGQLEKEISKVNYPFDYSSHSSY